MNLALEHVHGVLQELVESSRPVPLDQRVGILTRRERSHTHAHSLAQQLVARAEGGAQAGVVGVVEQDDLRRVTLHELGLLRREPRTQGRHDLFDPREGHAQDVEVSFDQNGALGLSDRVLRDVQVVEQLPLMKDRCIG